MTLSVEEQQKKTEEKINRAGTKALLKALESDEVNPKILSIWNDRSIEKIEKLQAELDELKKAAGNTADFDAAVAAKNVAEAELETIKAEWNLTVGAEVRKVRDEVATTHVVLTQREIVVKRNEDALKVYTDKSLTARAFEYLSNLVRRMESWRPTEFFDHEIPKSPWLWRTWWSDDKAKSWCAWEVQIAAMPREKQAGYIASELHAFGCMQHQREKADLSLERREFLEARAKYMGIENEVYEINRRMTEYCRLQPHPMSHSVDFDYANRRNMATKMITGEGLPPYL